MDQQKPTTVDEYIAAAPEHAHAMLNQLRQLLRMAAPDAKEQLKWGQPVFEEGRILYSFSAYKSHINFMPTGPTLEHFHDELQAYKLGKDTIQFQYGEPLPEELILRIARHRRDDVVERGAKWMY